MMYKKIKDCHLEEYWKEIESDNLSEEFKDLFINMVCYDSKKRYYIEDVKKHKWMQIETDFERLRSEVLTELDWK